jgi:hypothetical protein
MYAPEHLFIRSIDALRRIVANPTEENLFAASAPLRQLLLDEHPRHSARTSVAHVTAEETELSFLPKA